MRRLEGHTAVVTGAGRGIGKAIAEAFAKEGAAVLCVSRNPENCQSVAEGIRSSGGKANAFPMDVSDKANIAEVCQTLLERYPKVDILVNNAGIIRDKLFIKMSDDDWEQVLFTDLFSAFYICKQFVPSMARNRWGRIINMASVSGVMGNAGQTNYAAAKGGLIGFTKSLAKELAGRAVTVNAIAPGFIDTQMAQSLGEETLEQVKKIIPAKRLGTTENVANAAVFLASDEASYITGQVLHLNGGLYM